ncbi:MAG TPA: hypothetical protein VEI03_00920 [Stellaceae bacterium]|nr:hypothetical protein [Stellaceae bacterium]
MTVSQLSLFAGEKRMPDQPSLTVSHEQPEEFIADIRAELQATLLRVSKATSLPWSDLTRATLAELRFKSIAGWLPEAEAAELRTAFALEMRRLYELAGEA